MELLTTLSHHIFITSLISLFFFIFHIPTFLLEEYVYITIPCCWKLWFSNVGSLIYLGHALRFSSLDALQCLENHDFWFLLLLFGMEYGINISTPLWMTSPNSWQITDRCVDEWRTVVNKENRE